MAIIDLMDLKFKCPNCGKDHILMVSNRSGIIEWECLSGGIYRSDDCCGMKYIVRYNIKVNEFNVISYKIEMASEETVFQHTVCASCGEYKQTPLRRNEMGGYVCLTCIDKRLDQIK